MSAHGDSFTKSYIAIDDISFSPECIISSTKLRPGQSPTTPLPILTTKIPCGTTNQFYCKSSGKCIENFLVCNFHDDCGDNSDELECGTCKFDRFDSHNQTDMCGWYNQGYGRNQWVVRSGASLASVSHQLPFGNARGNTKGNFLIIDTSKGKFHEYHNVFYC